jgi:hypothetical protein
MKTEFVRGSWKLVAALVCGLHVAGALAQVQTPASQLPAGEGRLPTESAPGAAPPPGGDDCRRQAEQVRQQFDLQARALRREMTERSRQASESEQTRLRAETEQRVAALRAEAAEAERRVMSTCRG